MSAALPDTGRFEDWTSRGAARPKFQMPLNRIRDRCAAVAIALLASGCAVTLSDQDVSTIITHEALTPTTPVDNLGVAMMRDTFVPKNSGSKPAEFTAAEGNDHVRTLFPALLEAIPRVFSSNGIGTAPIAVEQVRGDDILSATGRFDYVLLISPYLSLGRKGMAATELSLNAQIYDRHRVSVWRGQVILRTDHVSSPSSPMYKWGAAMADDAAHTLLTRLAKEAIVKTGPAVTQSIDVSAFRGTERRALQGPQPPASEPEPPTELAAVQLHSPAGVDVHLFCTVEEARAALPAAPSPQIKVDRLQTLWDQKDGIVFLFVDGVATSIEYDAASNATIPALGLRLGDSIKDFEAKLGQGKAWGPRDRVWPLDARRELVATFVDSGKVQSLKLRARQKPRSE